MGRCLSVLVVVVVLCCVTTTAEAARHRHRRQAVLHAGAPADECLGCGESLPVRAAIIDDAPPAAAINTGCLCCRLRGDSCPCCPGGRPRPRNPHTYVFDPAGPSPQALDWQARINEQEERMEHRAAALRRAEHEAEGSAMTPDLAWYRRRYNDEQRALRRLRRRGRRGRRGPRGQWLGGGGGGDGDGDDGSGPAETAEQRVARLRAAWRSEWAERQRMRNLSLQADLSSELGRVRADLDRTAEQQRVVVDKEQQLRASRDATRRVVERLEAELRTLGGRGGGGGGDDGADAAPAAAAAGGQDQVARRAGAGKEDDGEAPPLDV